MVKVTQEAFDYLCSAYQLKSADLTFLGGGREDSDGIAYCYYSNGLKMVLKILSVDKPADRALQELNERLEFAHFLGTQGISISYPVINAANHLYETYEAEKHAYIAYAMNFIEGECPKTDLLPTELSYHWGRLIGKAHKITKTHTIWKKLSTKPSKYGYIDEIEFFINWCKNDLVKDKFREMLQTFNKLPINRDSYGFIHNDNHQHNIIVKDQKITLIDFDVASCQFFMHDIVVPVQGILFDLSGGMFNRVYNKEPIKRYFDHFINGYEKENHIDEFWLKQIDTFINYRRLMLFTCMQGYLSQNKELENNFLNMIKEAPEIYSAL